MELFEVILSAGGHANSLGRSREVYDAVTSDTSKIEELFDCVYADDAWVRMRAIDTFEKLVRDNPSLAAPYTERLVGSLTKSTQPSIQWHLAQLFAEIELDPTQKRAALQWLKDTISTVDVDWIVSANVMKTLMYFYKNGSIDKVALLLLFTVQTDHKSNTVRKKARQHIDSLQK